MRSILDIADVYDKDILETACKKALKDFYLVTYNSLISYVKEISRQKKERLKNTSVTEKSHGIVRGAEACRQSLRTCYIRMPDMLGHFGYHKDNLREQIRYRKRLSNYKVLIIDEWLNYKINERESKFIYELIEARCGNNPTIFVSQYGTKDWHDRLGGGTQADSIMNRIIHNSYKIPTTENNLRKLYDSKKAKAIIDSLG